MMNNPAHLYLSYIPDSVNEFELGEHIGQIAKISEIIFKYGTVPSKKMAFVTLEDKSMAQQVVDNLNQKELKDCPIKFQVYTQRQYSGPNPKTTRPPVNDAALSPNMCNGSEDAQSPSTVSVSVTHAESASEFYVQLASETAVLANINVWLQQHGPESMRITLHENLNKSFIYGAPYFKESGFYRVKILDIMENNQILVHFIDFGNDQVMQKDALFKLPGYIAFPNPLAHKCTLFDTQILNPDGVMSMFNNSVIGQPCDAVIYRKTDGVMHVDLVNNGKSLRDGMMSRKLVRIIPSNGDSRSPKQAQPGPSGDTNQGRAIIKAATDRKRSVDEQSFTNSNRPPRKRQEVDFPVLAGAPKVEQWEGIISHTESLSEVYIQKNEEQSIKLMEKITTVLPTLEKKYLSASGDAPAPNDVFFTEFSEDSNLYRCSSIGTDKKTNNHHIRFIDFGNTAHVSIEKLVSLVGSDLISIPPLAHQCFIVGLDGCVLGNMELIPGMNGDLQAAVIEVTNHIVTMTFTRTPEGVMQIQDFSWEGKPSFKSDLITRGVLRPVIKAEPMTQDWSTYREPSVVMTTVEGNVTHATGLDDIWVQMVDRTNDLGIISNWMMEQGSNPTASTPQGSLDLTSMYGAVFSEDGQWYRCKVVNIVSHGTADKEEKFEVQFVDFGNKDQLGRSQIVILPESVAQLNPLALSCGLTHLLEPVDIEKLNPFISKILTDAPIMVTYSGDSATKIFLKQSSQDLETVLLEENLVTKKEPLASSVVEQRSSSNRHTSGESGRSGERKSDSPFNQSQSQRYPPNNFRPRPEDASFKPPKQNGQDFHVKSESRRSKFTETAARNEDKTKLPSSVFNGRLRLSQYHTVFGIGASQQPLGQSVLQMLDSCIQFREVCDLKGPLDETYASYLVITKQIESSSQTPESTWDEVQDLLTQREDICKDLCTIADDFEQKCSQSENDLTHYVTQLQTISKQIKECSSLFPISEASTDREENLQETYMRTIENIGKCAKVKDLCSKTLKLEADFQLAIDAFNELLSNQPASTIAAKAPIAGALWLRMERFSGALDRELAFYDETAATDAEGLTAHSQSLIFLALGDFLLQVTARLTELNQLVEARKHFAGVVARCRDILAVDVSPEPLEQAVNRVKKLRSSLRHKIADLEDAIENNNSNKEELELEVTIFRAEIHEALLSERTEMKILLKAVDLRPEYLIKYKNLNLANAKNFILSWDPLYFDFNKTLPEDPCVVRSVFNKRPVLIRKVIQPPVEIEDHLLRYQALTQESSFAATLLPITAAFRSPNDPLTIYLIHPTDDILPASTNTPIDRSVVIRALIDLLGAVIGLHTVGLSHATLSLPGNAWMEANETIRLAPPQFPLAFTSQSSLAKDCAQLADLMEKICKACKFRDSDLPIICGRLRSSKRLENLKSVEVSLKRLPVEFEEEEEEIEVKNEEPTTEDTVTNGGAELSEAAEEATTNPEEIPLPDTSFDDSLLAKEEE